MPSARKALPDFQRYQLEFTRHIRNPRRYPPPAGVEARRMNVYNRLLYRNVESFLLACFPVSRRVLGKRKWTPLARGFFAEHRCRTPLFQKIPEEFLSYLESRNDNPDWLAHLAHYEWVELALDTSPQKIDAAAIDATGDLLSGRPALNPARFLLRYPFAVHKIAPRRLPRKEEPTDLLVFRDLHDRVRFIVLNPLSARLVELIQDGDRCGDAALAIIADEQPGIDRRAVREGGSALLESLRHEQAVLGTWKPGEPTTAANSPA
jgi:hypothetical protein